MTCASSAKRSRMLPPVDVIPALSSALRYSRATDLRCSSVIVCVATAMVGGPFLLQSASAVDAGHEGGEVVGGEKGRRWGRTPVEQALGALKCLRSPQLVVEEERTGDGQVCGAQHGVAELSGLDPLGAQHARCPGTPPLDPAGAVVRGGAHRCLGDPGGGLDGGPYGGRLLDRRDGVRSS